VKTVVFMLLYGGGVAKLAGMLDIDLEDAERLRNAVLDALPGVRDLMYATNGQTIVTWGGRVYAPENPRRIVIKGRDGQPRLNRITGKELTKLVDFGYKQLNVEIQGSAADITKQGMRQVFAADVGRIALQVHDELGVMVKSKRDALRVTEAMCALDGLNVPMTATPKLSKETWARCKAA
jgi:DNA polymerase I-like protein with 3'-5' exonuclease and polymerase domains